MCRTKARLARKPTDPSMRKKPGGMEGGVQGGVEGCTSWVGEAAASECTPWHALIRFLTRRELCAAQQPLLTVADHEHVAKVEGGLHQAVHVGPRIPVVEAVRCKKGWGWWEGGVKPGA